MLRNSVSFIRSNLWFFALVVVVESVLPWVIDFSRVAAILLSGVVLVADFVIAYLIYRRLLRRTPLNPFRKGAGIIPGEAVGFSLRSLAIELISFALPLFVLLLVRLLPAPSVAGSIVLSIVGALAGAAFGALVTACFGTWLPAYVYGRNPEFASVLKRWRASFKILALRLVILDVSLAVFGLLLGGIVLALPSSGMIWFYRIVSTPLETATSLFATVYVAIALCQTYLTLEEIV
ncbi:UNVERIFIED_ORG: hypothetical protein BCL66_106102 [Martelella mediterranea]